RDHPGLAELRDDRRGNRRRGRGVDRGLMRRLVVFLAACATAPPPPPPPPPPQPPPWTPLLRRVEPPPGVGAAAASPVVAARVCAIGDSPWPRRHARRPFAQSPFPDRHQGIEVAIRPAALDDGSALLLATFLAEHRHVYPRATLVYTGDAADLSCA